MAEGQDGLRGHSHIAFEREPEVEPERRRGGPPPRPPKRCGRRQHALAISTGITSAGGAIDRNRTQAGVDPSRLIVLEFDSRDGNAREVFEDRLNISVIDEHIEKRKVIEVFARFLSSRARDSFEELLQVRDSDLPSDLRWRRGRKTDLEILKRKDCLPEPVENDDLLVLEWRIWNQGIQETIEKRFGVEVVATRPQEREVYKLLVQFPTVTDLETFKEEIDQYANDEITTTALPHGKRFDFFDAIERIRAVEPKEREGTRLQKEGWPEKEPFYLDVDLWHPGTADGAREILEKLRSVCRQHGGQVTDDTRTTSLLLARVSANRSLGEVLLKLDFVARVDLPPKLPAAYTSLFEPIEPLPVPHEPREDDPIVAVIDSGVLPGHPLLQGWVVDERDFNTGEGTPVDQHGHGTQVAGLVVYGDVASCLQERRWHPKVRICSGKVLRRDPNSPNPNLDPPVFPENRRPEAVVEEAIRYFHDEWGCRIFNLSLGNAFDVYRGGRQFPWAEKLDQLAKELDIVIVIAAGNRGEPPIPNVGYTRDAFQEAVREQMLDDTEQRICNPATAAIGVTVGAIARSASPRTRDAFAAVPEKSPAPFSRVGPGYQIKDTQRAVKPEFVSYGGNYAVQTLAGGQPRWIRNDLHLGEPILRLPTDDGRVVGVATGTSFSCPHISHSAAIAERTLRDDVFGADPSANAIRALLGACAEIPDSMAEWLQDPQNREPWEKLWLVGYGICLEHRIGFSTDNDTCLIAEDEVAEDRWHVYALPVPHSFLSSRGKRGITVALAYDPPVRASRREYLSRTMWVEVLKGMTIEEIEECRGRHVGEGDAPKLPQRAVLDLRPTKEPLQWSTLQVRRRIWSRSPRLPIIGEQDAPVLHVVVGCQRRFSTGEDSRQRYALAIRFWHESERVRIHQELRDRVRTRAIAMVRIHEST